jgi:hypothetical protein
MSGAQGPMQPPQQQLPPQVLQMLQQRMQQQGQPGGGGGPMPPGAPMGGPGPMAAPGGPPPQGGSAPPPPGGPAPMGQPQQGGAPPGQQPLTPAQMAQKGRFGDSVVAHLTPGEVEVPPQVQTPQLMHMLQQAFAKAGVSPAQFTAGSPQSSHNPATGAPEYSLLAALLPILGGVAGTAIGGPGVGTAIGGALGGAAGGVVDHTGAANTLASAAGGGIGGYLGSGGLSGAALADGAAGSEAAAGAPAFSGASTTPFGNGMSAMANPELNTSAAASLAPSQAASAAQIASAPSYTSMLKPGLSAGFGSALGGMVAPPSTGSETPGLPPGFNKGLPPLNRNFNQLLGNGQSSQASFNGYNPYQAASGQPFNVYSPNQNGT